MEEQRVPYVSVHWNLVLLRGSRSPSFRKDKVKLDPPGDSGTINRLHISRFEAVNNVFIRRSNQRLGSSLFLALLWFVPQNNFNLLYESRTEFWCDF